MVLTVFCGLSFGCKSRPKTPPPSVPLKNAAFHISVGPDLAEAWLQIDVFGLTPVTKPIYENVSMTDYWRDGSTRDNNYSKMSFDVVDRAIGPEGDATLVVSLRDIGQVNHMPADMTHLAIFADLPGIITDSLGNNDPRRIIIPLSGRAWAKPKPNRIDVTISRGLINCVPPFLPPTVGY